MAITVFCDVTQCIWHNIIDLSVEHVAPWLHGKIASKVFHAGGGVLVKNVILLHCINRKRLFTVECKRNEAIVACFEILLLALTRQDRTKLLKLQPGTCSENGNHLLHNGSWFIPVIYEFGSFYKSEMNI
jgi:hypothetical protein